MWLREEFAALGWSLRGRREMLVGPQFCAASMQTQAKEDFSEMRRIFFRGPQ
jgi:hypothetical protein